MQIMILHSFSFPLLPSFLSLFCHAMQSQDNNAAFPLLPLPSLPFPLLALPCNPRKTMSPSLSCSSALQSQENNAAFRMRAGPWSAAAAAEAAARGEALVVAGAGVSTR